MPKNRTVFYLLLLPAPWFCVDFVPVWLMWCLSALLAIRIFRPIPTALLVPSCMAMGYMCFQDFDRKLVPESAISFLNVMLMAKLGQKEESFTTSLTLGILWAGSFAVFNNSIYYLAYLAIFFLSTVHLFKKGPESTFTLESKSAGLKPLISLAKTLPLIMALFFFFPRFPGFLPSANSAGQQGTIGYSKDIDNSNAANLGLSSKTAFYAETGRKISQSSLYWRGRIHANTDGYNWKPAILPPERVLPLAQSPDSIRYEIQYEQDLEGDFILLETLIRIEEGSRRYSIPGTNTFRAYRKNQKLKLTAVSNVDGVLKSPINNTKEIYLKLPDFLPRSFKELNSQIQGKTPGQIIGNFSNYLRTAGYQYTINPGPMPNLANFIENKRGFCTHYASLLGILLRHRGIPARLVSGFHGGEYNEAGGFYTVRSNDAHAWVEFHHEGSWKRVDPTGFVSPERLEQGGQAFLQNSGQASWKRFASSLLFLKRADQFISNLNYKLNAFLDDYDRDAQAELAKALNLKLKHFYIFGTLLGLGAIAMLLWIIRRPTGPRLRPEDVEFKKFEKKLSKRSVAIRPSMTEAKIQEVIEASGLEEGFSAFINVYVQIKYKNKAELLPELARIQKTL